MNKTWLRKQLSKQLEVDKLRPLTKDDCILLMAKTENNELTLSIKDLQMIMKHISNLTKREVIALPDTINVLTISKEDKQIISNILKKYQK